MFETLERLFFPRICSVCYHLSDSDKDLCSQCEITLPWVEDRCFRCGLSVEDGGESVYCQSCLTAPPPFDRLCALFSYEPPITQFITGLKFSAQFAYGKLLGELLIDNVFNRWYKNSPLPEAVLPVPLHLSRLRKRGFNQALELLTDFKKNPNMVVLKDACVRIRNTPAQAQSSKVKRKRNMKGIFQVVRPLPFEHVAIMDDVVTTGSTVSALTEILKEAGVVTVDIWCIARA